MAVAESWIWQELDPEAAKDPAVRAREEQEALEDALRDAYRRGVEDGLVQGSRQAQAEVVSVHRTLSRLIEEYGESVDAWRDAMADSMAAIATAVAHQILEREISTSPDVVNDLIASALETFPTDHAIRIRVSHGDYDLLRRSGADAELTRNRWAQWSVEESLTPGSFLIEGPENIVDGRIDHALENLYRRMAGA